MRRFAIALTALSLVAAACTGGDDTAGDDDDPDATEVDGPDVDTGDCIVVDMAVSSEKIALLEDLADRFNTSADAAVNDRCIVVRPRSVASGLAATLIPEGWPDPEANGEPPVIWSPAASAWAGIVNDRAGQVLAPAGTPFMLTPLVIAMPQPLAEALGWPAEQLGFADLLTLSDDPAGWGSVGHPEWGPFRLGKTNPNYSTSGLNFTIAEYYAAVGKTQGLTVEDLARPAAVDFATRVESSVVH
jgi:Ca-activated chloride channel family protein